MSDVYVVGYEQDRQTMRPTAKFWKNGIKQNLKLGSNHAEAVCVFVK